MATTTDKNSPITVRIVYRNYRPIHKIYQSIIDNPPAGIRYIVPPVQTKLRKLFPLYRKLRYFAVGRLAIHAIEKLFFLKKPQDNADLYHYICMIDSRVPDKPYVVDVEHAASMLSFTYDLGRLKTVKTFLGHPNCKSIDCQSKAARRTLQGMFEEDYALIADKVTVVYPSLMPVDEKKLQPDHTYIKADDSKLKILFVGNRAYLKGLEELLEALKATNKQFSADKLELHIISDDADELVNSYKLPNVFLYQPKFSERQMITQFYMPADVMLSPTKQDTYGMALIEALSCGTAVVATAQFAIPELITDGVDGILLKPKKPAMLDAAVIPDRKEIVAIHHSNLDEHMVTQLTQLLADMLNGKIDLKKMGEQGKRKFLPGAQLSAITRNQQLERIYKQAVRRK